VDGKEKWLSGTVVSVKQADFKNRKFSMKTFDGSNIFSKSRNEKNKKKVPCKRQSAMVVVPIISI